ncbi:MAG: hypothetical protein E6Q95_03465 [Chitinophagaceae bacterium]|nr:MAG: hypothetical protein E6Q95_03465 [Chitinophagaceae bacterium]
MKYLIGFFVILLSTINAFSQGPVSLNYRAQKIADNTYELHITASIQDGWHLYSQFSDDKGGVPASINFTKNPLVIFEGKVKEVGKLKSNFEELFGVTVKYFEDKVDFVQIIKLKGKVKTNIAGTISYMVCNDKECMPPTTKKFSIPIQ